ncbi:bifunctional tetrahydrofolate synthase/dihydrofolate synthase [Candidatus Blochmannia ocreatus (nom. nud.)]|uniref:Dihydrofolate synthase/folylpolyglutamate synthase n=1 Tax=Candidatus Blochmannia ocreatus (nom. nud.) TaxID=251538 RepID=A0ABY4SUG5_9ENTR|nr:bifunctional tetrahydrofolate synthase/dihydrofolate synthase [Candidatus Blochmannia ocreatus]URJ24982.1 bifunctional tetrahydrofolate synthase/dihydrofolate synthase [Candidatus Blochmannia ocreatus]
MNIVVTAQSSLIEWLLYIENLHSATIDLNLNRVRALAIALDLIHPAEYVILVGGTNGKGTTCCVLETILLRNNTTVGLYTSPHLLSYNERVRVCGRELSDSIHVEAFSTIEKARGFIKLTYFEFITLSALYIFKQYTLDVVILEIGLGGRLDAANVVNADISVITNIGIDHTEFLGNSREMIAREKSGIFRFNKPAIIGDSDCPYSLIERANFFKTSLFIRGRDWDFQVFKNQWSWWSKADNYKLIYDNLPIPKIPVENAAVALSALKQSSFLISKSEIHAGLESAFLPGRFQIIRKKPTIILDVGHNPHAANFLIKKLVVFFSKKLGTIRMVIGMLKHKDISGTIYYLRSVVNFWYCASLNTPFSASCSDFSKYLINCNVQKFDSILDALNKAVLDSSCEDCIVVFGSFYAVSPVLKQIDVCYI